MYIVMLGAPGTGKGTIGKILSHDLNLVHISTGDIFREQIAKGTELGKKIQSYIDTGALVPDDVTIETVKTRLLEDDVERWSNSRWIPKNSCTSRSFKGILKRE